MPKMPSWTVPNDITKAIEENDGYWESDTSSPFILIAMTDTKFGEREIPIAWQVEFDPTDEELELANDALEEKGIDADGYGWGDYIRDEIEKSDPPLAERLHLGDCEQSTCVVWVESEEDCRKLLEVMWGLAFDPA